MLRLQLPVRVEIRQRNNKAEQVWDYKRVQLHAGRFQRVHGCNSACRDEEMARVIKKLSCFSYNSLSAKMLGDSLIIKWERDGRMYMHCYTDVGFRPFMRTIDVSVLIATRRRRRW